MPLQVTTLKREFYLEKEQKLIPDPNPKLTPEEAVAFMSHAYPQLITATCLGPEIYKGKARYTLKTTVGVKG